MKIKVQLTIIDKIYLHKFKKLWKVSYGTKPLKQNIFSIEATKDNWLEIIHLNFLNSI